jgi:hypothetical protein
MSLMFQKLLKRNGFKLPIIWIILLLHESIIFILLIQINPHYIYQGCPNDVVCTFLDPSL